MFFNSCQMVYLLQNKISVSTQDIQHISKNCQTQSSLSRVENHVEEIKHYCDGNEMSDCFDTFPALRAKTKIFFKWYTI